MPKKSVTARLTAENNSKLRAIAKRNGWTLSKVINESVKSYSGKKKVISNPRAGIIDRRIRILEKELARQRQWLNIFKKQVARITKSQNEIIKLNSR